MNYKQIIFTAVPILSLAAVFLLSTNVSENNRVNNRLQSVFDFDAEYEQKLNQDDFEEITRESIDELETEILSEGFVDSGTVEATDNVTVHYQGWRANDGFVFDSTIDENAPRPDGTSFGLGQVIPGWTEGLQGMKVGEVRRIFIPSAQAYGEPGQGEDIPPNSDLIFDVELISIN